MDKLLISTFFALLAGSIAAAMSFVKLVNDKESRITDYREEWTNSVRKTLGDLVGQISSISHLLASRAKCVVILNDISKKLTAGSEYKDILSQQLDHQKGQLESIQKELTVLQKELNQTYNFARLHFKQGDTAFSVIEGKFDNVKTLLNELSANDINSEKIPELRGKLELYCSEIIVASRGIMKSEWERIKTGELTFQKTKNAAKWGGAVLVFFLLTVAIHATISSYRGHSPNLEANALKEEMPATEQLPQAIKPEVVQKNNPQAQ